VKLFWEEGLRILPEKYRHSSLAENQKVQKEKHAFWLKMNLCRKRIEGNHVHDSGKKFRFSFQEEKYYVKKKYS